MNIIEGSKVRLIEEMLWAPVGAIGTITNVVTDFHPDDIICWELHATFPADQLNDAWVSKDLDVGLYYVDVELVEE